MTNETFHDATPEMYDRLVELFGEVETKTDSWVTVGAGTCYLTFFKPTPRPEHEPVVRDPGAWAAVAAAGRRSA